MVNFNTYVKLPEGKFKGLHWLKLTPSQPKLEMSLDARIRPLSSFTSFRLGRAWQLARFTHEKKEKLEISIQTDTVSVRLSVCQSVCRYVSMYGYIYILYILLVDLLVEIYIYMYYIQ